MNKQDEINAYNRKLLDDAHERIEKLKNNVCANLTRTLRKKYKNKIVKSDILPRLKIVGF
jgi:chemotaxis methyl-accepting protein methylase